MNIAQAASKKIAFTMGAAQSTSVALDVVANVQTQLAPLQEAARRTGMALGL